MKFIKRYIFFIFLLAGIFTAETSYAQAETREHKRMWRRFGRKKHPDAYNPNVAHGKSLHKQTRKQKREDAKLVKEQKRQYKRWQKKSKRKAGVK